MKFLIIFVLCSVIYKVNSQLPDVDAATQLILNQISLGQILFNDNTPIDPKVEITFHHTSRLIPEYIQLYEDDPNVAQNLTSKPIVFIVHGWLQSKDKAWVSKLAKAWLNAVDCNVIVVDYKKLATYIYNISALRYVPQVGAYLCLFLKALQNGGVLGSSITIAGHSLGAHVAGIAGSCFGEVEVIYGLDAAGPLFTYPFVAPISDRLDQSDAKFVSAIHTTASLGAAIDLGHSDYYMGAGISIQCGCTFADDVTNDVEPLCSHTMCITYMIHTLDKDIKCKGIQGCSTISDLFKSKVCIYDTMSFINPYQQAPSTKCIYDIFGIYSQRKPGRFFVPTKAAVPHCFGV